MANVGVTTYTDAEGNEWTVTKKDYGYGDIDYYLTPPTGPSRPVKMKWSSEWERG